MIIASAIGAMMLICSLGCGDTANEYQIGLK